MLYSGLLLRGTGGVLSPPTPNSFSSYFQPAPSARPVGSLAAANLFIKGLTIELGKPLNSRFASDKDVDAAEGSSDEDGAEGTYFDSSLERVQDLLVGVRDACSSIITSCGS